MKIPAAAPQTNEGGSTTETVCTLTRDGAGPDKCQKNACLTCGWNREEAERRKALIRAGGLERDERGLTRLILRKTPEPTPV